MNDERKGLKPRQYVPLKFTLPQGRPQLSDKEESNLILLRHNTFREHRFR
jgi:hypothetical protein